MRGQDAADAREAVEIAERKKQLVSILADVATLGSERMVATIGKASLRDAAIGTGVAVDKMLALTGQTPALQIANIVMPSAEERAKIDASHRRSFKPAKDAKKLWSVGNSPCDGLARRSVVAPTFKLFGLTTLTEFS